MRIIITGVDGFIGGALHEHLSKNHEVIPFDRESFTKLIYTDSIEPTEADAVIHCAAITSLDECEKDPKDTFLVNVYGTYKIAKYSIKSKVKAGILLSSGAVYRPGNKLTERSPIKPSNIYGLTKLLSEDIVLKGDTPFTVLRLFFPYGKGSPEKQLMRRLVNKVHHSEPITIQGNDGPLMNPLYIDDLLRAIDLVLMSPKKGAFNLGGSEHLTLNDIISIIGATLGKVPKVKNCDGRPENMNCDSTLFNKTYDFKPATSLSQGIRELARALNSNE